MSPPHAPHTYLRPYCPSPEWRQEGSLPESAPRGSPAEEGRGSPPGRSRATGPCTRTEKREGRQFFKMASWPGADSRRLQRPHTDLRRPRSRDPKPALKRKRATCGPENRTRNSPRVLSPLSGYPLEALVAGLRGSHATGATPPKPSRLRAKLA